MSVDAPKDPFTGRIERCERALAAARTLPGAFLELDEDGAREAAARSQERIAAGAPLALDGLALAVKDSFAVAGLPRRLGLVRAQRSERDAAAVATLRDAGAIVLGTTAMDQLAWTMTGRCPGMPPCGNPLLPGRSPGGSSAGAAAAVAGGAATLGLGADSAGSVRVPAAWCGLVGFKPTFGSVPLDGCAPLARRFDTVGLLARDVAGVAAASEALRSDAKPRLPGAPLAAAAAPAAGAPEQSGEPARRLDLARIGVPGRTIESAGCDRAVQLAWERARESLCAAFELGDIEVELEAELAAPGMGKIFGAELAARWSAAIAQQPPELVEPEVREGVERGATLSAAQYVAACDALDEAAARALAVFERFDVIALPVAPILPPPADEPASVARASAFTGLWSGFGWPAIAIPLPCAPGAGLQLVGAPGGDEQLLALAAAVHDMLPAEPAA